MLRVVVNHTPCRAIALAAGACKPDIVVRNVPPVCLLKVLAKVLGFRVVFGMPFDRIRPMVRCPHHLKARHFRALAKAAKACKEIDRLHADTSAAF